MAVLNATDDKPRHPTEIAERAMVTRYERRRFLPDTRTTRNTLGWLAVKGLVMKTGDTWKRR